MIVFNKFLLFSILFTSLSFKCNSKEYSPINQILGLWEICSKEFGTRTIKYLTCPEVQFLENNKGYVIGSKNTFIWHTSSDTLFIKYSDLRIDNSIFCDSIYLMAYSQKTNYIELKLSSINNCSTLVLGKSIE
jgi:hypothetical protein